MYTIQTKISNEMGDFVQKIFKKGICVLLACVFVFAISSCGKQNTDVQSLFTDPKKMSYSTDYYELSATKTNKTSVWRQGMVSGNGLQGVVTSGSPYSDTLIFQNIHFILPNQNTRDCPVTSDELETVKQNIAAGKDITDDAEYLEVYSFHPGASLRIDQQKHRAKDYIRYTDYETAQVGVRYTDTNGTWERAAFTSQVDGVTVTRIGQSSEGSKVNLTLSYDDISTFANFGDGCEKDLLYKKQVTEGADAISMVAHYPNYENSELKNGGYATVTYVICENGTCQKAVGEAVKDTQYVGKENPQLQITDADAVYLLTISDRTYDMGAYDAFADTDSFALTDQMYQTLKGVAEKYTKDGVFDYDEALKAHTAVFTPLYDAVTFSLADGDSDLPNETLLKKQRHNKNLQSALVQRAYYAGRYAYLCCAGYSTSRLGGMWTGEWNPGWGSKFTMDANVNLQTSSMNTGNLKTAPIGYTYFLLRQAPDWEENAFATHGYTDALQAPVHTDGDNATLVETCYPYPFRYWNAGASWMLQPLYETLQCYGDMQIPLSNEFDLEALKSVLSPVEADLTDAQIAAIRARGYLDLRNEILLPMLTKSANYWAQMMTPEYYTDANGYIHYEAGKTELKDGETYCILPGHSPENNPANYPSPSVANCAIDIAACRDNLNMLISVSKQVDPNADVSKWETLLQKLPPYLYDDSGALKEWAAQQFEENNEHRHLSHLYCVWPLHETQNDTQLKDACIQAIDNRESENEASHALVHRSLIAARLKDRESLTDALTKLMNHKIHYDSLLTNHDYDRGSAYCTDFAIGYLGIINESLVYSNDGVIEVLPALPETGFGSGSIAGIKTRTRATVENLVWNVTSGKVMLTVQSDIDQTVEISCGLSDETQSVTFKAGESKTLNFAV